MKNKSLLLEGIIYLVVGILLVVGVSGNQIIGWILSISLLIGAAAMILTGALVEKSLSGQSGFSAAILLTLGLILMPADGLCLFAGYFPTLSMLMIVLGAVYLVDSIFGFVNKRALFGTIFVLVLGAILFTFGMLLWFNVGGMTQYSSLILGIVLICYAALILVAALTNKEDLIVITVKK